MKYINTANPEGIASDTCTTINVSVNEYVWICRRHNIFHELIFFYSCIAKIRDHHLIYIGYENTLAENNLDFHL